MSKFVDRPRYSCALGGAVGMLRAMPRTIAIVHGSAGCGGNINAAINAGAGYLGGGYCGGSALPSSNVVERDVVFGGETRLREQIKSSLEILDGDLFVVVTGCMVDMIGDDTVSVVAEFADSEKPVIAVPTPSFKGSAFTGYELLFKGLIQRYIEKSAEKDPFAVNVLGIVPAQDVFWKGNLREIKRLLEKFGLHVNTFFGEGETLDNFKKAGKAAFTIVVSNNFGIESARYFEEVHGIPYIVTGFPIGAIAGETFLKTVGNALHIAPARVEQTLAEEKSIYYDYFERISDLYNDIDLQRYAVVVGDSNYAPALTRFLSDELGWLPELAVITDLLNEQQQQVTVAQFAGLNSGISPQIHFDSDTSSVKKHLRDLWPRNRNNRYYDAFGPAVILGSSFERELAQEFGFPLVPVSFPLTGRCVMNRAYAGFNGGLSLTEDIISYLVAGR
ncbi:oxidoreductase nitrogenase component 1 [Spirochaetia bacterium]|nr:oxidoreductase nitrogenase component 1 [Spirochaetia bacterium]GHU29294.1 oxidoreductase nitrogenase component 1 [Spirochaetia bacterium]